MDTQYLKKMHLQTKVYIGAFAVAIATELAGEIKIGCDIESDARNRFWTRYVVHTTIVLFIAYFGYRVVEELAGCGKVGLSWIAAVLPAMVIPSAIFLKQSVDTALDKSSGNSSISLAKASLRA